MAPSQKAPDTFHPFLKLPKEIRFAIWDLLCEEERVIPVLPGVGHLSPITHTRLAVPALLHVSAEARQAGLRRYNLNFHPRVYTNPARDYILRHIWYPQERIDAVLYKDQGFRWGAVPRLAVFLDDISFRPGDGGQVNRREQELFPFAYDFVQSLECIANGSSLAMPEPELLLLILPPLTARPNPTAQHLRLVPEHEAGTAGLAPLRGYLQDQLRCRVEEHNAWLATLDEPSKRLSWTVPKVALRYATCTPWPKTVNIPPCDDLRLGRYSKPPPVWPPRLGPPDWPQPPRDPRAMHAFFEAQKAERRARVQDAVADDMEQLRRPYCGDMGLGPHIVWNYMHYCCGYLEDVDSKGWEACEFRLWEDMNDGTEPGWTNWIGTFNRNGIPRAEGESDTILEPFMNGGQMWWTLRPNPDTED